MQNGRIIKSFGTETVRESICKPSTLKIVHEALLGVVEGKLGTGHAVKSKYVRIAGKSGTALISKGGSGYKSGGKNYLVSFCGYFPADNPLYTCIVVIRDPQKGYASGGTMSGSVFRSIAEHTMALKSNLKPENMVLDSILVFPFFPIAKSGNYNALETAMSDLGLKWNGKSSDWVKTLNENESMSIEPIAIDKNLVPDLIGMGAKDAMFLSGQSGLRVQLMGKGKVVSQHPRPGESYQRGEMISLKLEL
jgi:cell division protein FtsI (penicillin-binding protein 3)